MNLPMRQTSRPWGTDNYSEAEMPYQLFILALLAFVWGWMILLAH